MKPKKKLQVFVSSTFKDLKAERQAAVGAILKAGHIPAGMELFTSGDRSQMMVIEKWIDESDVYMLILGGRYGSVESTTNLSYTELEYDYAKQRGKPMFAVVIHEDALNASVRINGPDVIERENPKELKLFRDKVLSNVSSFFSDEKDIRLCVHESLADLVDRDDLVGWVSGDSVEDTRSLHEEMKRLREENSLLAQSLEAAQTAKPVPEQSKSGDQELQEIINLLLDIEIKVPEGLTEDKKELTLSLFSLLLNQKDTLLTGVTNAGAAGALELFLYYNVCPKLQIHGLAENEKVAGVRWRRSYINQRGTALLSYYERKRLQTKQLKSMPPPTSPPKG